MAQQSAAVAKPFIEHVQELRQRLFVCTVAVVGASCLGYGLSDNLIDILKRPLHQTLYYTNPTGAFSFVIKLSLSFGFVLALPVLAYQLIKFLSPLMHRLTRRYVAGMTSASILLAAVGIVGAYYISLPSALQFLTSFHSNDIKSLITADAYFSFVLAYLAGSAFLFQLPLLMIIINRITPLKPKKLMSLERYVIVGSFIVGAVLTPTPDPINQTLMSVPIVITYQIGVVIVWLINRRTDKHQRRAVATQVLPELPEEIFDQPFEAEPLPAAPIKVQTFPKAMDIVAMNVRPARPTSAVQPQRAHIAMPRTSYTTSRQSRVIRDVF